MKNNKVLLYVLYAVVVVVLAYAIWATKGFGIWKNKSADYQAVFLSNGQVYFGQMKSSGASNVTLEDIYYLRVQQIQPKAEEKPQGKLTLIKLGNELHAPQDKMIINRDHILFYENLKSDGKVAEAIKRYKEKGPDTTESNNTEVNTQK